MDKPLVKDEKLDLDELISAHKPENEDADPQARPKVEMIDFADIEAMINETRFMNAIKATSDPEPAAAQAPKPEPQPEPLRPLDTFDGFKIDPTITDGLADPADSQES